MLLKISEFRDRIANDLDRLVSELQRNTHRYGFEEEQCWSISLPRVSEAFTSPSFANLDLYFREEGNLALEYHLPAAPHNVPANGSDYTHYIQDRPSSRIHADPLCEVGCPDAVHSFDFDYIGILWMSDLVWRDGRWQVNPEHIHETGTKRLISAARNEKSQNGPARQTLAHSVQAAYLILLTRPIKGLHLRCEDLETKGRVKSLII